MLYSDYFVVYSWLFRWDLLWLWTDWDVFHSAS